MADAMFCPRCKAEYTERFTRCSDCRVALVEELPPEPEDEPLNLVTAFAIGDPVTVAIAKSLLEEAGIRYLVRGEGLQDLFALGRVGFGFNPLVGPIEIQVRKRDQQEAAQLLGHLEESDAQDAG